MPLKSIVKNLLVKFQIPLTRNIRYDIYTNKIMQKVLKTDSSAIDIGCHKGEILDEILRLAPNGKHFAFEPLPHLYEFLKYKYKGNQIVISPVALFNSKGTTDFNYVIDAPAFSGIRKRKYDLPDVRINQLKVDTDLLDNLIPENQKLDFIKIDVEGAEFAVLQGGIKTIQRNKPVIIFEFGLGAADFYGSKPADFFSFLSGQCGLCISTLKGYLKGDNCLDLQKFSDHFFKQTEYYFIAYNPQ
jgi:FkbM family methyltransferase